jgi:hypothetical protein
MSVQKQVDEFVAGLPEPKRNEMQQLQRAVLEIAPGSEVWFFDGKNDEGKTVTNPSVGYGQRTLAYADGSTKDFYRVGISPNSTGISVFIIGLSDKTYLARTYGKSIGKAKVTGYCIKFNSLKDVDSDVLRDALRHGMETAS